MTALGAIAAAACGASHQRATPSTLTSSSTPAAGAHTASPPTSATPTRSSATATSTPASGPSAQQVATSFAAAYARYLDGRLPAAALPAAEPQARSQAGQLLPVKARRGLLAVRSLSAVAGGPTFIAQLADHAHSFPVQLTVRRVSGHELVVALVAPDFDSILEPPPRPLPQPAGSASAQKAARAFMTGYLPWLYAEGPLSAIHDATAALLGQLRAHPPNVPPSLQGLHPRLAALGMQRHPPGWDALANVTDGHQTYDLTLTVLKEHGRWLVNTVTYPGG